MLWKPLDFTVSIQHRMGTEKCNLRFLLHCFAQLLKPISTLNLFWLLVEPPIVLQGNSLSAVSLSITLGSTFEGEDWQTEHSKFINCKLLFCD